jgi:iron complex transport system permease protein
LNRANPKAASKKLFWLAAFLLLTVLVSVAVGRYPPLHTLTPQGLTNDVLAQRLIFNLRIPRVLTAVLVGASLAASGAVMQMIFGNPLVEPGFLGVSQGAGFGAALAIIFLGRNFYTIQGMAAVFAFLGLGLSYIIARRAKYGGWILRLILAGIAVSALFSSGLGILKYVADPLSQLPEITFWLLGGLWGITWPQFLSIVPVVLSGLLVLFLMRWRLNLLSLSDQTAFSLGSSPARERLLLLVASVMITAAVVSVAGMVSWVGLLVPHIARRLFGADARYMLPASMLIGAIFTLICDDLGRSLFMGEIPLGILTSLIGASLFVYLMCYRYGSGLTR